MSKKMFMNEREFLSEDKDNVMSYKATVSLTTQADKDEIFSTNGVEGEFILSNGRNNVSFYCYTDNNNVMSPDLIELCTFSSKLEQFIKSVVAAEKENKDVNK